MNRAALLTLIALSMIAVVPSGQAVATQPYPFPSVKILPVDEAAAVPELAATRDRFLRALRARDTESLASLVYPDLHNTELIRFVRQASTNAAIWGQLERPLLLGGAFTTERGAVWGRREFCAPYAYANYPRGGPLTEMGDRETGEVDAWVVIGRNVAVRHAPSLTAPVMARVSYELLPVDDRDARDRSGAEIVWQGVNLPDGRYGFIAHHLLWGASSYHACFGEFDGRWLLTKFGRGLG